MTEQEHFAKFLHSNYGAVVTRFKIMGKLDIIEKPDLHQFIKYFDKILNETFFANSDSLNALHIHIEDEFDDIDNDPSIHNLNDNI